MVAAKDSKSFVLTDVGVRVPPGAPIEDKVMNEREAFYARCSEILGIPHEYHDPVPRRNRWNTRRLGNGRFPGFGLIQSYGGPVRVIRRGQPTRWYNSHEEVLDMLTVYVQERAL
jgi:hypothetical protein